MSKQIELEIKDQYGLHAKKCLAVCQTAQKYSAKLQLIHNGYKIDVKSILGLLSLAVPVGSKVILEADGIDADEAIDKLKDLVY